MTEPAPAPQRSDADRWRAEFEDPLQNRLRDVFAAGRWLSVAEISQGAVGRAQRLVAIAGREPGGYVLALAGRDGVGPLDDTIPRLTLDLPEGDDILDGIRLADRALADLPDDVVARIDRWDPDGQARVSKDFTMSGTPVAGRPSFGGRRPEWEQLEDKLAIIDLWDDAGVKQAPTAVVETADRDGVMSAHQKLAGPLGTVWAVDNDKGWHGGAIGTHWVAEDTTGHELLTRLASDHRRIRIMPFLDGVPCSIHGMVIDGDVISFRPTEMVVFRDRAAGRLVYGKAANFWQPGPAIQNEMERAVEAIGTELQRRVDFRGVFTVDGVAASTIAGCEGFVPTEVNTRYGAALPAVLPSIDGDGISLYLTSQAEVEGELRLGEQGITPADLQRWVRGRQDDARGGLIMMTVSAVPDRGVRAAEIRADRPLDPTTGITAETVLTVVDRDADSGREIESGGDSGGPGGAGPVVATVRWGSMGERGMVFLALDPAAIPVGPTVAPQALALLGAVDAHWEVGTAGLEAAG